MPRTVKRRSVKRRNLKKRGLKRGSRKIRGGTNEPCDYNNKCKNSNDSCVNKKCTLSQGF